jgi:hypothetical protein
MKYFLLVVLIALIVTTVWDGNAEAASVPLTWDAPITNADGTPITNFVGGYRIYRGTVTGTYTTNTTFTNPAATVTTNVTGLTNGTLYFFVVTAVNTFGNESGYSNEVSKVAVEATPGKATNLR